MPRLRSVIVILRMSAYVAGISVLGASTPAVLGQGNWRVERERTGDTLVVRTLEGSVWTSPRVASVTLTIGSEEGQEPTLFGNVTQVAPDSVGGIYIYDGQVPVIRHFNEGGQFVGNVGREGEGPGEYGDAVLGMSLRGDGRLQIWDARNGRVTIYSPDDSYSDQWRVPSTLFAPGQMMFVDAADNTYIKSLEERPVAGSPWKVGLLRFDAKGAELDPIPAPRVADAPPYGNSEFLAPSMVWTFTRSGFVVVGVNSSYSFEVRKPTGSVTRIERRVDPTPVTGAEYDAYEERRQYVIRTQGQFMTTLPEPTPRVKPAYRALAADANGRIWVERYGPVTLKPDYQPAPEGAKPAWPFIERGVFDVFEADGAYLGEVRIPSSVNILYFGRETLWGVREAESGNQFVVRLGIEGGGQ